MNSCTLKDHGHTCMFYLNHIFFEGAFEHCSTTKFWGSVGTNAELICVEFYNFGQHHIFVSYLSSYC
jgi:hypothetical protein